MNEFAKVFNEMGIERALLTSLTGMSRSVVHKYIEGDVSVPASAMALIRALQLMQKRSPELFKEFLILQEFNVAPEHYIDNPELHKVFENSIEKAAPSVKKYLGKS
ncbi:hypothetical protein [Buttiauxella noackiae]|uniref:hypothetical protein n=1 Tax=Buttiauxella noackiae TaxID=82992 RepID=UPI00055213CA|nr:hypothetical protein [Buttiauxella noackiae]